MERDKNLESKLDGMFDDADAEPEPTLEEIDLLPEEKIISILESKPKEEQVADEPAVMEDQHVQAHREVWRSAC